jgi:hypothetical protein
MEHQQIGEEFQKRFKTLPEDIQNALTAVATVDILTTIGKKSGLMVDQVGKMADEIWKVMLGLADPKDFIRNLANAVNIDPAKASAIAGEVNAQIFQPVRESLRRIYDQTQPIASKEEVTPSRPPYSKEEVMENPPLKPQVPPMIYPQDRFEEEFKKDLAEELGAGGGVTEEKKEEPPSISPIHNPSQPPLKVRGGDTNNNLPLKKDDFTYPEKTKDMHREEIKGRYQNRDPYREAVE